MGRGAGGGGGGSGAADESPLSKVNLLIIVEGKQDSRCKKSTL